MLIQTKILMPHYLFHFCAPNQKNSFEVAFAPTAEAKKVGRAIRRAEDTLKPPLTARRMACKN